MCSECKKKWRIGGALQQRQQQQLDNTDSTHNRSKTTHPPPTPNAHRFGFNVGMGMVDGLWAGGTEAATDFALITYQIRLLGYNAVRLPFIWKDLDMPPKILDKDCDPVTIDFIKKRTISPHVLKKYLHKPLPGNVSPQKKRNAGYCNQYLPQTSNYHRLMFTAQSLIAQGIYVVLDYQPMVRASGWAVVVGWRSRCREARLQCKECDDPQPSLRLTRQHRPSRRPHHLQSTTGSRAAPKQPDCLC